MMSERVSHDPRENNRSTDCSCNGAFERRTNERTSKRVCATERKVKNGEKQNIYKLVAFRNCCHSSDDGDADAAAAATSWY